MSDQRIAAIMRDLLWRRMSHSELCVCELIADGLEYPNEAEETHTFRRLKTEFSREIAEAATREGVVA